MALCANLDELKVQRLQKILAQQASAKSTLITKLFQFSQGHPKPAFSEKVQRGDQGKFFKNRPKSSPRLKGLEALAQMALSSNQNAVKVQGVEKILRQESGSKSARMGWLLQFSQGHSKPTFSEKVQRGDKGKILKNRLKSSPRLKGLKGLAQMALSSNQNELKEQRLDKILAQKKGSKNARMAMLLQFSQGYPKPAFSKKVQREDEGKCF